ncbi:tRNA pseudouridine(38-40) synthase TruA [Agreia sp. COWG]|uniref:tRNA pseudouridine(38-40) synthase TruA n=1 Tax=Agreia sp. COWG TaxID=2773266 RepID=UPI00192719CD|nr:tRNA pseudouridine(38-40) synthase TruA [Agreia sp. COWG]CAD6004363.1 tRNA pseudouridine synthase A [Agreia sp. COWG]
MTDSDDAEGRVRVRLDLAYDGTAFSGWAKQPALRTVQGVLEDALGTIYHRHGPAPALVVAGRTDAGVHATGQVAHLDLTPAQAARLGPGSLARRLNGVLGSTSDVVVTSSELADAHFDARFSATWRRYEYRLADATTQRNPLERGFTAAYTGTLDAAVMHEAAGSLLGLRDFASFCKPREGATTIRSLQSFSWHRDSDGVLVSKLQADAFCHSMVRALVGACVAVGEGRFDANELVSLSDALQRTSAFKVMPARGLILREVGYPEASGLAARAVQTRAKRA